MSKQEFSRLDVLLRVQSGHLRVGDACALIGLQDTALVVPAHAGTQRQATEIPRFPLSRERRV